MVTEPVPGAMVRLRARPEVVGVVTAIDRAAPENRVAVFHDGAVHTYFVSQLEPAEMSDSPVAKVDQLISGLVANQLRASSSSSTIFSFNSGRIDYEPYQFRPVMKLIAADRPRILIADDVGVGKTIEAGLILKELQARQRLESVLVICPKPLVLEDKWRIELKRFDEDFVALDSSTLRYCIEETHLEGRWPARFRKAILPYSLLDEKLLFGEEAGSRSRPGLLALVPPATFDLVIVDEAHHVRNADTWRHRVVETLLASAEAAVLISATPIQTGAGDLLTLLRLLRPDLILDDGAFDRMREPNAALAQAEEAARAGGPGWSATALGELSAALATRWGASVTSLDPRVEDLRRILDAGDGDDGSRVQAVRLLGSLNSFAGLISRTRRRDIGSFTTRKPETVEVDFTPDQGGVYRDLIDLSARIVATRHQVPSIEFLLSTLRRQASSCLNGLGPLIGDMLSRRLSLEEVSELDGDEFDVEAASLGEFEPEILALASRAARLGADPKLDALLRIAREKAAMPNPKLLVFSTFRHTLRYLHEHLTAAGLRVGLVHGGVRDDERRAIRADFARSSADPTAVDVLLSSEVGTEGLDNQFCDTLVNYDLPWNPMRIEQRIGRIDRRGQVSETVSIKNLIVRGTVDAAIYHRCLLRIGVFREALGGSEAVLGEITRDMRAIADDLGLTEEERDERLRQLADNKLGLIQEQLELEEREGALFGLAISSLDEESVEAASSPWLSTEAIRRLVADHLISLGYARGVELAVSDEIVLRPDAALRARLLEDERRAPSKSSPWRAWLESDAASRRLVAEAERADDPDTELLSASHPLVVSAARDTLWVDGSRVGLTIATTELPPGRHPFAIHRWTSLGLRDEGDLRVLTTGSGEPGALERLILRARDSGSTISEAEARDLDSRHYDAWVIARERHREATSRQLSARRTSLAQTHAARVAQLRDQIDGAADPRILRMRTSQLERLEREYVERIGELDRAVDRTDVVTRCIAVGVLEVTA